MIADALLLEGKVSVFIGGKEYKIPPPTIERIAGAGRHLASLKPCSSFMDIIQTMPELEAACKALSWFIQGDENLHKTLQKGTLAEIIGALTAAVSLMGIENFPKLSALARNVQSLIAITR